jgi:hypothetical protein
MIPVCGRLTKWRLHVFNKFTCQNVVEYCDDGTSRKCGDHLIQGDRTVVVFDLIIGRMTAAIVCPVCDHYNEQVIPIRAAVAMIEVGASTTVEVPSWA